eukprot:m.126456 g.126456  ORF g.126456 m.126456 type:complete len:59 (-) comp9434_c1_seq38:479-655(-)
MAKIATHPNVENKCNPFVCEFFPSQWSPLEQVFLILFTFILYKIFYANFNNKCGAKSR